MTNQDKAKDVLDHLINTSIYNISYSRITGSALGAIILSKALEFDYCREPDKDGYWEMSIQDWMRFTGMTLNELTIGLNDCSRFMDTKTENMFCNKYRVDKEEILFALNRSANR